MKPEVSNNELRPFLELEVPAWEYHEIRRHINHAGKVTSDFLDSTLTSEKLIERRKNGEPLEYILKHCHVGSLTLKTDSRALIPRPETETLVRKVIDHLNGLPEGSILDCGTGCGFIAGWFSEHTDRTVYATDLDSRALTLCQENIQLNNWDIHLLQMDRLRAFQHNFSTIIANLPYIIHKQQAEPSVINYEPRKALFPAGKPLDFFQTMVSQSLNALRESGELWLELSPIWFSKYQSQFNFTPWKTKTVYEDNNGKRRYLCLKK